MIMGYLSKVQVIERANLNRQFYLICPAPLAQALELEKGEEIEWIVEDKATLLLKRPAIAAAKPRRPGHGK
jgi:bifunctional DNA-binding transcriptional regulator/antitoxin component of YhaV-PrlF toxin-antitoxin module